jgi:hypothetical protein
MVARDADIFVLYERNANDGLSREFPKTMITCALGGIYHVESDDMLEGDLASLETLDQDAVDDFRAATSRQAQNKWLVCSGPESFNPAYSERYPWLKSIPGEKRL